MSQLCANPESPTLWDIFCRVIDNFGDIGVCWRLARDLAARGQQVRLWVDDASALAWMAPQGAAGVQLMAWSSLNEVKPSSELPLPTPGDVVVECFGCDPPPAFVASMAALAEPPVWINLEYLSAESYVERSHRLRSPQLCGLDKWFFYPGFTAATGGLLHEPGLLEAQASFDASAWLAARGWEPQPGERVISLFCYDNPRLPDLLQGLVAHGQRCLLLTTPGPATQMCAALSLPAGLRQQALPWLTQADYDLLLQASDLNLVRGEDSMVRAQWAGQPMLWQIYPQHDGVHALKLEAFLKLHLAGAEPSLQAQVASAMRAWNGLHPQPLAALSALPDLNDWRAHNLRWRAQLAAQASLTQQLLEFVAKCSSHKEAKIQGFARKTR